MAAGKPAKKGAKQQPRRGRAPASRRGGAPAVFSLLRRRKVAVAVVTFVAVIFILSVIFAYPAGNAPAPPGP